MITDGLEKTSATPSRLLTAGAEVLQGRFRVIELLGRGGMGDVYLAEQVSLGRKVALKTLREDLSTQPGMTERFKREALLLSQVEHPSVVRIIDFGQAESAYVLVMEYVEGENLALASREGPFAVPRALRVLSDIAEGLEVIHARGIVHRDLKLDNVLLATTPAGERARLLDFGIARLAEAEGGNPGGSVTQAGLVLGTPEYLAPEQATGGKIDARSDVYAFGILAYRLLTGRHPFPGPSAREFLLQHISQEPPPIRSFAPQLPEPLAKLVMSCLAKSPAARPDGGKGLREALAAMLTTPTPTPGSALTPMASPAPTAHERTPVLAAKEVVVNAARKTGAQLVALPSRTRRIAVAVAAGVIGLVVLASRLTGDATAAQAGALLDQGRPGPALELVVGAKDPNDGALRMLRAEALHQLQRHSDEWSVVANTPEDGLKKMRPALLAALVTDFPSNDDEEGLRAALSRLPKDRVETVKDWAKGRWSAAQWGALRWADTLPISGADLVSGYIAALDSNDCEVNSTAARRLGELGDAKAIDPLKRLLATPRKGGFLFFGRSSCGHDEASVALRRLGATPEGER